LKVADDGGIVVASGGANSTPSSASAQRVVVLGSKAAETVIHIARSDGADTLTFKVRRRQDLTRSWADGILFQETGYP
jgi:hypothetical protein